MVKCQLCEAQTDELIEIMIEKDWEYLVVYNVCEHCQPLVEKGEI
jgi:hypothetical protein